MVWTTKVQSDAFANDNGWYYQVEATILVPYPTDPDLWYRPPDPQPRTIVLGNPDTVVDPPSGAASAPTQCDKPDVVAMPDGSFAVSFVRYWKAANHEAQLEVVRMRWNGNTIVVDNGNRPAGMGFLAVEHDALGEDFFVGLATGPSDLVGRRGHPWRVSVVFPDVEVTSLPSGGRVFDLRFQEVDFAGGFFSKLYDPVVETLIEDIPFDDPTDPNGFNAPPPYASGGLILPDIDEAHTGHLFLSWESFDFRQINGQDKGVSTIHLAHLDGSTLQVLDTLEFVEISDPVDQNSNPLQPSGGWRHRRPNLAARKDAGATDPEVLLSWNKDPRCFFGVTPMGRTEVVGAAYLSTPSAHLAQKSGLTAYPNEEAYCPGTDQFSVPLYAGANFQRVFAENLGFPEDPWIIRIGEFDVLAPAGGDPNPNPAWRLPSDPQLSFHGMHRPAADVLDESTRLVVPLVFEAKGHGHTQQRIHLVVLKR